MPTVPDGSTAATAIATASETFLAGRRVKMQDLAEQLGVTRMTLNRAVGTRSRLLGEVLWSVSEPLVREHRAAVPGHGAAPLAAALRGFLTTALESEALLVFLRREPAEALAVLTTGKSAFQANVVALLAQLLEEEARAAQLELPLGADDLAYAIVRLLEAFTYTDLLTGGAPDPAKAERVVLALLS